MTDSRGRLALIILISVVFPVSFISYLSLQQFENIEWSKENRVNASEFDDESEYRRTRRAVDSLNQFVRQMQLSKNCCVVPQIVPKTSLDACVGSDAYTDSALQARQIDQGVGLFGALQRLFGGRRSRRSLQTFGVQAICYTDCVFRKLNLVNDNGTLLFDEANRIFMNELGNVKLKAAEWQNVTNDAFVKCLDPASKGTPLQIVTGSGRICFSRPIILMTCVKRLMAKKCTEISTSIISV
ncbi:Hypothetical predicted protein [Cloeon dipterum]|uniref:Uncharacterized protein n=1 Tax=Cloeon dipterum TaxID=197152 RepID=A0A8S1C7S8_9INSE|nr:Hypothetical predicted protein [Cloeon dipterum]